MRVGRSSSTEKWEIFSEEGRRYDTHLLKKIQSLRGLRQRNRCQNDKGLKKLVPAPKNLFREAHHVGWKRRNNRNLLFGDRVDESDRSRMEEQPAEMELDPEAAVEFHITVQRIHHHGATDLGEMLADLMSPSAFDLGLHNRTRKTEQIEMPQHMEEGPRGNQFLGLAGLQGFCDLATLRDAFQQSDIFLRSGRSRQDGLELSSVL